MTDEHEMRCSLIQGVINCMEESGEAKRRAMDILDQLKSWLDTSLMRDTAFKDRMVQAIADNAPPVLLGKKDDNEIEIEIGKIAQKYNANGGDNAGTDREGS